MHKTKIYIQIYRAWGGLVREILARWVLLPAMDLLADGAIILKLLERLLDHTPLLPPNSSLSKPVPTLHSFVSDHATTSPSVCSFCYICNLFYFIFVINFKESYEKKI
jgi:hypothetical protein